MRYRRSARAAAMQFEACPEASGGGWRRSRCDDVRALAGSRSVRRRVEQISVEGGVGVALAGWRRWSCVVSQDECSSVGGRAAHIERRQTAAARSIESWCRSGERCLWALFQAGMPIRASLSVPCSGVAQVRGARRLRLGLSTRLAESLTAQSSK